MKWLAAACLLATLQSATVARAYEADVHFSTTYALARAVGWPQSDALTIASANQAVDENQHTVAALELNAIPSPSRAGYVARSLHQARKNLSFHCFSATPARAGRVSADVLDVISAHFAGVPAHREGPRGHTDRLIALGTALHCQQDAFAHVDFGGSCGAHSGSCYGHTYENLLDEVVFRLLGTHRHNPDHPGVSGEWVQKALEGTVRQLSAHRPKGSFRPIASASLIGLSDALRKSGLELPDDVRRECNRHIAGKWLFDELNSADAIRSGSDAIDTLSADVAVTCGNPSLAAASVVRIPDPRYPRLNDDASPSRVRADGTYQLMHGGDFHGTASAVHTKTTSGHAPNDSAQEVRFQLSHWSQLLALPLIVPPSHRHPTERDRVHLPASSSQAVATAGANVLRTRREIRK